MLALIEEILLRVDARETLAVCVVAKTRGSTPQKAGAMMLVLADGKTLGTLGGGCVEAEVRSRAIKLMSQRENRLLRFKLDHDYGWDDGLVCGGTMEIAVQTASEIGPWQTARDALRNGESTEVQINVIDEDGEAQTVSHRIDPMPTLVIAGAGHVGGALAMIGRQIGFAVTVIDDRIEFARPDRLGNARCVVGPIDAELAKLKINPQTYVVIVTRGHKNDAAALAAVINSPAKYIGLIGSKRKILTIFRDLHSQGISRENLSRVHAPIGLDIGAVSPGEIAVSIAAELIAVRRGITTGTSLQIDLSATTF